MMSRCTFVLTIGVLLAAGAVSCMADDQTDKKFADLVAKLGSESFEERENAQKEIADLGRDVLPLVEKALAGATDPEVKWRLQCARTAVLRTLVIGSFKKEEYTQFDCIENPAIAAVLPGVSVWCATKREQDFQWLAKKAATVYVPGCESAAGEVRRLSGPADICKLFADSKVSIKGAGDDRLKEVAFTALLLLRLSKTKCYSFELLPGLENGGPARAETWSQRENYKILRTPEGTVVGGVNLWDAFEEFSVEMVFSDAGLLAEIRLARSGKNQP